MSSKLLVCIGGPRHGTLLKLEDGRQDICINHFEPLDVRVESIGLDMPRVVSTVSHIQYTLRSIFFDGGKIVQHFLAPVSISDRDAFVLMLNAVQFEARTKGNP